MLSMMVKDHRTQCAQTLHNVTGARSKGERYAFRATNGRARNIVRIRFTSWNKSRNRHWRIKRHWPGGRRTAFWAGVLRGWKLEKYHIGQNAAARKSFEAG